MVAYRTELMLAWGAALVMRECYMCIRAFWMLASKMTSFVPFCLPHATTREQNSHGQLWMLLRCTIQYNTIQYKP